jgi:hypothetical protein
MADFLPSRDAELVDYGLNFANTLVASPTTYDVTAAEANGVHTLALNYQASYQVASNPATRTKGTVASKDTDKAILKASLRSFARRIQAVPTVTAQEKLDLGIPVHSAERHPRPLLSTRPMLSIRSIGPREITVVLVDETTPTKRARAAGSIGAPVYTFVGDNPPADLELWRFEALATRSEFTIGFNAGDVNKPVHICAAWMDSKGRVGPVSMTITSTVAA